MSENIMSIVPPPRPLVKAENNRRPHGVQAIRRNARGGQPEAATRTLPSEERCMTAIGQVPQAGKQVDTTPAHRGGRPRPASSNNRTSRKRKIYDPLLGRHLIPVVKIPNLMELIVDEANILRTVKEVNSEPKKATGCDKKTVKEVCDPLIASAEKRNLLRKLIMSGKYRPATIRIAKIPKGNGKMRSLGIAIVRDRIVQRMILQAVTDYPFESPWSEYSYAYQHKMSVANVIEEVNKIRSEGYTFAIALDLRAFFDNVPHDRLIRKLQKHIADKRVVRLIIAFLTTTVIGEQGHLSRNRIGTPQGSALSQWLASSLYLDELDREAARRGLRFVRYADDVTIFCHSARAAKRIRDRMIRFLEDVMKCPVNREKTEIMAIEDISILGVQLRKGKWHVDRDKHMKFRNNFRLWAEEYTKTPDKPHIEKVIQVAGGFLAHYQRIPDIAVKEINAIKRWCLRIWNQCCSGCDMHHRRWFLRVVNP